MFTIADLAGFKELILANASYIFREQASEGAFARSQKVEIILSKEEELYTAVLADLSSGKALLTSDGNANPALAVHSLLDQTSEMIGKEFREQRKQGHKEDERKEHEAYLKKQEQGNQGIPSR